MQTSDISEGIDTQELWAKRLLRESNSILLNQPDGLLYLREFFTSLMDRLGIDWQSHALLSEHHQAFFDSSAAKMERLRREEPHTLEESTSFARCSSTEAASLLRLSTGSRGRSSTW